MGYYDGEGNRKAPYKEDSTNGASLIQPRNYKCDVLAQIWIDARILATLNDWLDSQGNYARSMADVARKPLEMLVESLVKNEQVKMVDSSADAREKLQIRFRVNLNRGGRGNKNTFHNKVLDSLRPVSNGQPDVVKTLDSKRLPTKEEVERAVRIYEEIEKAEFEKSKVESIRDRGISEKDSE